MLLGAALRIGAERLAIAAQAGRAGSASMHREEGARQRGASSEAVEPSCSSRWHYQPCAGLEVQSQDDGEMPASSSGRRSSCSVSAFGQMLRRLVRLAIEC